MNIAGLIAYAQREFGQLNWGSVLRAQAELEMPYEVAPPFRLGEQAPLSPIPISTLRDLVTFGQIGVFTIEDFAYRRASAGLRRVEGHGDSVWLEALRTPDGQWIVSPQRDTTDVAIYLFAPVIHGPNVVRLATFDTGLRPGGTAVPPSVPVGNCDRGVDGDLNWICLQGSCTCTCEPDGWVSGDGPVELTGCSCS